MLPCILVDVNFAGASIDDKRTLTLLGKVRDREISFSVNFPCLLLFLAFSASLREIQAFPLLLRSSFESFSRLSCLNREEPDKQA